MKNKILILKITLLALAIGLCVGLFFSIRAITSKHQVVSIHKVINRETDEEVTVYDDPEFEDFLDEALADLEELPEESLPDASDEDLALPDAFQNASYGSKNPKNGSKVEEGNTERDITISLSDVAYSGFMSSGGHSFPEQTSDAAVAAGFDSVDWELTKYFYHKLHGGYTRVLHNMDAMMTNNGDPEKDCKDWTEGKFVFDNDQMQSFWRMIEAQKDAGSIVYLNTGWKVATRIQSWYGASSSFPKDSAPYDLKAFVRANIRLLQECEKRYPGVVKYIAFGNEAAGEKDFAVDGDTNQYLITLNTLMSKALQYCQTNADYQGELEYMSLKNIKLFGGEEGDFEHGKTQFIQAHSKLISAGVLDGYTTHMYYDQDGYIRHTYDVLFEQLCYLREMSYGSSFNNETSAISYCDVDKWNGKDRYDEWWNFTFASNYILTANAGSQGLSKFSYGPAYWPTGRVLVEGNSISESGEKQSVGHFLFETKNDLSCTTQYYTVALLQNYITAYSDVLTVDWEGEDIRVAAFKLDDGNYTFLVEAKESTLPTRELNFQLDKAIGKKLYRFAYSEVTDTLSDTLVPISDSTWTKKNVGASFSDEIGGDYSLYLYTTKEPVKQLSTSPTVTVEPGKSVNIPCEYIECEGEVVWTIVAAAPAENKTTTYTEFATEKGTIDGGVYHASDDANPGDRIVVKVSLKDDPSVYSVALVQIDD